MGGKVTALGLDVITEKSGHVVSPIAPSVCTTPAAPSPLPVPYPATGSSAGGIVGAPSRTKINGAPIGTVGGALSACHGNEPGTMKEVVSLNTGGAVSIVMGAPVVLIELGMAGVTGSPVLANKGPGGAMRCAPAPMMTPTPGMAAGIAAAGGGAGSGGANGDDAGAGDGDDGAGGESGGEDAPDGQDGQCADGHPVDVITGRAYTVPAVDLELPGPLPLVLTRVYSSRAAGRDVGLGFGWSCSWSWEIEVRRRALVVWSDQGIATSFPRIEVGAEHVGPWGWALACERDRYVLDTGDGLSRVFAATDEGATCWKLIEIRDRNGNRIELTYDEAGHLAEVTYSAGRVVRVETTRAGRITSIQVNKARAQGRWIAVARFFYDQAANLATVIDAEGHAARYTYDDAHRLTSETTRGGVVFRFLYDHEGRCVETWGETPGRRDPCLVEDVPERLANGTRAKGIHHVRLDYGPGRSTEVADSGEVRRYFGNRHGLVDKAVEGGDVVERTYDARGLVRTYVDGEGAVTRYERDARGRVVRVVDPLGRATSYERDERGDVTRVIDPAGGVHELQRDACGNVVAEADPTGATTTYAYDARGLVTAVVSPTGGVTSLAYDAEGNLVEQVEPAGGRWRWSYDPLGRRIREVDPLGHETRFAWTQRGDLAAVYDAAGGARRYSYDAERRLVEIHGPGQRSLALTWGGYNRLASKTNGAGGTVRLSYDREGDLVVVVNEKGEAHRITRNGGGRVVREETFDGRSLAYRYDHAGRVVRSQVAGDVTLRSYDAASQLVTRTFNEETTEVLEHDVRGELFRVAWAGGEVRFERDGAGRVLREVQTLHGETHTVASLYDKAGVRTDRFTSRGHAEQIERDPGGARTRTILDELRDVHHARDAIGRETMLALPGGGRIHKKYDPLGRIERRWSTSAGSLLPVRFDEPGWVGGAAPPQPDRVTAERDYKYAAEGELSDAFDRERGWVQYENDAAGRLVSVFHEATETEERFQYDAACNHEKDGEPREYGPGGRLLRRGDVSYAWDAAGRLREKREGAHVWRYRWDTAGRLAGVELPDGRRTTYAYDPLGRRVEARLLDGRRSERTRFVWDGDTVAHVIRKRTAADGDPVIEERTFCFEDGGFVPWAQCDDVPDGYGGRRRAWRYVVGDPIGTPDELVDGAGRVVAEMDREAWGRTVVGGEATPLRFQGQHEDQETGLFYNRFRYYDAEAGLYVSPDPIGLEGGPRPYGYGINPTRWIDPLGLAINTPGTGVVYLRWDKWANEYVGRSKSKEAYDRRKAAHRRANPCAKYDFDPLQKNVAGPDLAQAEEDWIRAGGGPGQLQNKIHAQAAKNYNGTVPHP